MPVLRRSRPWMFKPHVVVLLQRFGRAPPSDHLVDFGTGQQPEDTQVLAAAPRNLTAKAMHGRTDDLAQLARVEPLGGMLHFPFRPLQISTGEDHTIFLASADHLVGIRELRGNRFIRGDALDPGLGTSDHGLFHVLGGRNYRRQVGNDLLEHGVDIFVQRLDAKPFPDNRTTFVVPFSDCRQCGSGKTAIDFGIVLPHATAADNRNTQLLVL